MPINIAIAKVTAYGEQITVHASQANAITGELEYATVGEMAEAMKDAFTFVDDRVEEMNMRHLTAVQLEQSCTPEEWSKCLDVLEILFGRVDVKTVASRWQSRIEEREEFVVYRNDNKNS